MLGDPLFSVPMTLAREGFDILPPQARGTTPHLCFEIHGRPETHFNLLSDQCVSVNTLYSAVPSDFQVGFNVLTRVGISALNSNNECIFIEVSIGNQCTPIIWRSDRNGDGVLDPETTTRFDSGGISVTRRRTHVRISVPNCDSHRLVMYVTCDNLAEGVPMIRFDITRGVNLLPTSHGLLGMALMSSNDVFPTQDRCYGVTSPTNC